MKKLAVIGALLLSTSAYAQEKEYDLKVNSTEVLLIGEALGLMPYGKVAPLMQKLQNQINSQNMITQTPPKPAGVDGGGGEAGHNRQAK